MDLSSLAWDMNSRRGLRLGARGGQTLGDERI